MDWTTLSEESWKNGFTEGYVRGVLDRVAEAMEGSIEWHRGFPKEDQEYCYICHQVGKNKYAIRPAKYIQKHGFYQVEAFDEDGYAPLRIDRKEIRYWAHIRDPFSMRVTFTVPEAKS